MGSVAVHKDKIYVCDVLKSDNLMVTEDIKGYNVDVKE